MPFIELEHQRLHISDEGRGDPVVLLHGLGSRLNDWDVQRLALANQYRVIAIDFRGHGETPLGTEKLSIPLLADDVQAVIEKLNLAPVHLVGFSLGGMVGLEVATRRDVSLRSLVVINSNANMQLKTLSLRSVFWFRLVVIKLLGLQRLARMIGRSLFPGADQKHLIDRLTESMGKMEKRSYVSALKAIAGWSVEPRLPNIRCRTLVISADNDYTTVEEKQAYIRKIPSVNFSVINNSRHATPLDQPIVLIRILLQFFSSVKKLDAEASDASVNQQAPVTENELSITTNARG